MPNLITVALGLLSLTLVTPVHAQNAAPQLSSSSDVATAGYFRLSWKTDAERVELQEASNPDFINPTTPYLGPDRATVISGKSNGTWYYRVRTLGAQHAGSWSAPVAVTVTHHSVTRALMFLILGIFVFVSIVLMVIRGTGKTE